MRYWQSVQYCILHIPFSWYVHDNFEIPSFRLFDQKLVANRYTVHPTGWVLRLLMVQVMEERLIYGNLYGCFALFPSLVLFMRLDHSCSNVLVPSISSRVYNKHRFPDGNCSKLTIETLEQGMKYLLTFNTFHTLF